MLLLLRCISFAKKAQVRISPEGIRFSTEEGSAMEAFVFLEKSLFSTYTYNTPPPLSSQDDDPPPPPVFEINLESLLETLNIFTLSDPNATKRPTEYESFRLNRHAGINAFSNHALGMSGICRFSYEGYGSPLSIHMAESGVTTTCDLTTYEADSTEEIPFNRDELALKTIMRSSYLLDAITELAALTPASLTILAAPGSSRSRSFTPNLSLAAAGALGSATVDFTMNSSSDTPILETFHCPEKTSASFKFSLIKAAQRAMAASTKVSTRLDEEGVLSLQFLVEVEAGGSGSAPAASREPVAFVDFRMVPLAAGEGETNGFASDGENTDDG